MCGTTLDLQVQASAAEGNWAGPYVALVGAPGSSSGNFPASDVPKSIQDLQTAISTLNMAGAGTVLDVNVRLSLTHTYDADLDIHLRGPDGTLVMLSTDNGSSGDNYTNTLFSDNCVPLITSGTAPFSGCYHPEGALASFINPPANGTWTFTAADTATGDTGTLISWQLTLCVQ